MIAVVACTSGEPEKTVVFVQAGIPSGEIGCTDAGLMLLRDIAFCGPLTIDGVTREQQRKMFPLGSVRARSAQQIGALAILWLRINAPMAEAILVPRPCPPRRIRSRPNK